MPPIKQQLQKQQAYQNLQRQQLPSAVQQQQQQQQQQLQQQQQQKQLQMQQNQQMYYAANPNNNGMPVNLSNNGPSSNGAGVPVSVPNNYNKEMTGAGNYSVQYLNKQIASVSAGNVATAAASASGSAPLQSNGAKAPVPRYFYSNDVASGGGHSGISNGQGQGGYYLQNPKLVVAATKPINPAAVVNVAVNPSVPSYSSNSIQSPPVQLEVVNSIPNNGNATGVVSGTAPVQPDHSDLTLFTKESYMGNQVPTNPPTNSHI